MSDGCYHDDIFSEPRPTEPPASGIEAIAAERKRQLEVERFRPENDDAYMNDELVRGAVVYALPDRWRELPSGSWTTLSRLWPWTMDWLKLGNRKRELEKAGALLAAEWDRLDRLEKKELEHGQKSN
jgi:hypothetical protein